MEKRDIFEDLNMGEFIWGNAFICTFPDIDLSILINQYNCLDEICRLEDWSELGETWNPLDFRACSNLLLDSIEFDIAYSSSRITPEETAKSFHAAILKEFRAKESWCFSNWFNNHWREKSKGSSWNSLTENTFDLSTVFINNAQILITCFRSED